MARTPEAHKVSATNLHRSRTYYIGVLGFDTVGWKPDRTRLRYGPISLELVEQRTADPYHLGTFSIPERLFRDLEYRAYHFQPGDNTGKPFARGSELQLSDPDGTTLLVRCEPAPLLSFYRLRRTPPLVVAAIGQVLGLAGLIWLPALLIHPAPAQEAEDGRSLSVEAPVVTVTPSAKWIGNVLSSRDSEGRFLKVHIDTLVGDRQWRIGDTRIVEDRLGQPVDVSGLLQEYAQARPAREIVVFGDACERGEERRETDRGFERAKTLEEWARRAFPDATIHRVNLGQYRCNQPAAGSGSGRHRAVYIAEVIEKDPELVGPALSGALRSAMVRARLSRRQIPIDIRQYKRFELETPRLGLEAPPSTIRGSRSIKGTAGL